MAKEIPYFKFYISEWLNADITLETFECQGVFINVCAYYWQKDADITLSTLLKRFRGYDDQINTLIESNLIKLIGDKISISFLNEQMESKEVQKITNRKNGLLGGRPKKEKNEEKPNWLNLDNRNKTETKANQNPNITNIKEKRVKKIKEEFIPPSIDDVKNYFFEKGYKESVAKKAFDFYTAGDWKDSKGNKVVNWKQKMISVWFKDENKISEQSKILGYTPQLTN